LQIWQIDLETLSMPPKSSRPLEVEIPSCGITIVESHHSQDFRMDWSEHPFLKVLAVINGAGTLATKKNSLEIQPLDLLLVPSGAYHRLIDDSERPLSLQIVCIGSELVEDVARHDGIQFQEVLRMRQSTPTNRLRPLLRRMMAEQSRRQTGSLSLLRALSLELLITFCQQGESIETARKNTRLSSASRMSHYLQQLESEFYTEESLEEAAARLGMSLRSFTAHFKALAGCSRQQKITDLRIEHARKLLQDSQRAVTGIAFECGYGDLSSFYRAFKRVAGCSPSEFRAQFCLNPNQYPEIGLGP
jgi:AraC-like DNA-binding protein/quercetin dioxygenase-like cupin family protein